MCWSCGYAGTEEDFTNDAVNSGLCARVWDELAPNALECAKSGSARYEAAARIAVWQGAEPRKVAALLLRAAWCCVDEGDVEAERNFRRLAASKFQETLESYDGVRREERAVLTYRVGELCRRREVERPPSTSGDPRPNRSAPLPPR